MAKKENQKNSRLVSWILGFILICLVVYLLAVAMPFVLIGGLVGIWYFTKKKPDIRKRNIAIGVAVVGLIGSVTLTPNALKQQKTTTTASLTSISVSSSSEKSSSKSSSSTIASSTETSSSAETSTDTSSSEEELPRVTADQMGSFIEYLKQDLTDKGVDISSYTFYNKDTILYVTVPNDYKYYNKTDLQAFADGLKEKEHEAFNVWAGINGVDFNSYPMLYIKTDDGNSLASQKMNGEMEVK